ncbi:MAG TPA: alpha/beta hydrolase-fold protein [Candidatus Dormibacteraeota bacterium]|nr:alpha/beta hydrolase-fold protein [Candidatus Dormibacteraeota bacterium]
MKPLLPNLKPMSRPVILFVLAAAVLLALTGLADETSPTARLIALARQGPGSAEFRAALLTTFSQADLEAGKAVAGYGADFLCAIKSATRPALYVDNVAGPAMVEISGTDLWFALGQMRTGTSHSFYYTVQGARFGGRTDVAAYGPDSYPHARVPQGKLSEKLLHTSKIYEGLQSEYWIYVPAQYDPDVAAALMVWQDGASYIKRDSDGIRVLDVLDNLIYEKKIPLMIGIFMSPGDISNAPSSKTYEFVNTFSKSTGRTLKDSMRSVEYDTVSDRYARFLRDEILAEIASKYNIRRDAYSRAITGLSSGGICAFNVAWQQPDQFSRVLSWIGSFASIQWQPGVVDGGNVYPNKVRKEPRRNIRVWLQDGSDDLENQHGSWPLQNIQLANSLKLRDYDFHFSFGHGTHNAAHGSAEFPEEMTWLWRGYDPSKTEQVYEIEPSEKAKPLFRVAIYNRGAE